MASETIEQLLRSTLVLVAHPDDESVGCGILLQRVKDASVLLSTDGASILLCTDGAPARARPWYTRTFHNREKYARRRLAEVRAASNVVGVRKLITTGIQDQMLYRSLDRAAAIIARYVIENRPDSILSHAFEAGHPDHDCCAFLARWAGRKFSLPVWEMPLYYRPTPSSPLIYQQFLRSIGNETSFCPAPDELRRKELMLSQHRSQAAVISEFNKTRELFRPQPPYDFSVNPNPALSTFAVCDNVAIANVLESFRSFGAIEEATSDLRRLNDFIAQSGDTFV
jgi:LmbE family N-acetylglucosaminyl deacetylase